MIINLLPTGLVGVMIAALLAALMGAMSSVFNSASTLVTLDFYKKIKPQATERQLVGFGRVMTGVMVLLGLAWVPFIHLISSQLYIYLQSVQAYISPPIASCFILGILWTRLSGAGGDRSRPLDLFPLTGNGCTGAELMPLPTCRCSQAASATHRARSTLPGCVYWGRHWCMPAQSCLADQ